MERDLIFDIGAHDGTDTDFYLKKGFRVVAVEANPEFEGTLRHRFADEIAAGAVCLLNCALNDRSDGMVTLHVPAGRSDLGTVSPHMVDLIRRIDPMFRAIDVPTVSLDELTARFGVPYFIKIDIEGHDAVCLPALLRSRECPKYLSIEVDVVDGSTCPAVIDILVKAGYRRFKVVNQLINRKIVLPNPPREGRYVSTSFSGHTSGPFGEETPGQWLDARRALKRCAKLRWMLHTFGQGGRFGNTAFARLYNKYRYLVHRDPMGWYDIHAALP